MAAFLRKGNDSTMTASSILGILSMFVGFIFFGGAFFSFHAQKSKKLTIALFCVALVFVTIIPVTLAVGWASINR